MKIKLSKDELPYLYGTDFEAEVDIDTFSLLLKFIPSSNTPCHTSIQINSLGPEQIEKLGESLILLANKFKTVLDAKDLLEQV